MADEENSVQVAVRMRIFNQREKDAGAERVIRMTREDVGSKTFIRNPDTGEEKEFKFDYSFNSHADNPQVGPYATQDTVFDDLGRPVMMSALEGRNVCLFAYGQTGAGKSFSMLGKSEPATMQGIIPRTCREIFKVIDKDKKNPLVTSEVGIQVVEIYCEQINDLLADRKTWPPAGFKPKMTKDGFACDTIMKPCMNYDDIEQAFSFADKNRSVGSHALNPESSRAHTIYQITYMKRTKVSEDAKQCETITTKLNLVDLAGSERMESAGTSGQMLKEGNAINLSLTALGNTIKALSEGKRAQFRESKLTLLLQSSMTNGKVIMIAAVSPASICYDESISTLRFAERIKMVKIKAKKNVTLDPVAEIKKEMEEMRKRMQEEIDELRKTGGGSSSAGGADPELVEELKRALDEQKENERQLKLDMERRLKEMSESEAARQERADKIQEQWKSALGGATTKKQEDLHEPHLLNLNEDSRLAETLIYALDKPEMVAGRANKESPPNLEFNGMGIVKNHCVFKHDKEKNAVYLIPGPNARCCVNGAPVTEKTELKHNYRVWLGNNYAFRFAFPGQESKSEFAQEKPDYLLAEAEIAKHAQASEGDGAVQGALGHQLSEALKKVEQANIIAGDLNRECTFGPKITKNRNTGEDIVVVNVVMPQGNLVWPWEKFQSRLVDMVKVWQEWQYATANDQAFSLPKDNPFVDSGYQLIGEADVWIQSLGNMIDFQTEAVVLSPSGVPEGKLQILIVPLDKNGNEGPWDEDNEDLDPFVDSPDDLKNKQIQFAVKVQKVTFEVELKAGGKPKYRDIFVRFAVPPFDDDEIVETIHDNSHSIDVKFGDDNHRFKRIVDDSMYTFLTKGKLTFSVFGKLADTPLLNVQPASLVVLPEGWKKVTAFQDPEGKLHLQPPTGK
jgi:kinesin family protein 1